MADTGTMLAIYTTMEPGIYWEHLLGQTGNLIVLWIRFHRKYHYLFHLNINYLVSVLLVGCFHISITWCLKKENNFVIYN
jgi:hypothetical protein